MKQISLMLILMLGCKEIFSQKKEAATLDETINYLSQKSKEIIGYTKYAVTQKIFINKKVVAEGHVKRTASGIEILNSYKTADASAVYSTVFNPKHIVSIVVNSNETVSTESPVGTLSISFIGKVALNNKEGITNSVDKTTFDFLQTDPDNAKRIINAFMHLKKLYKSEDSSFE